MSPTEAQRAKDSRRAVLEFLAPRQALKFECPTIAERIAAQHKLDFAITSDDVSTALAFLRSTEPALVVMDRPKLSSTLFFQATAAGVLALERGELD